MKTLPNAALAITLALCAAGAHAANYSLWINGRDGDGQAGHYDDFSYWGPSGAEAGVNKKAVNWDGYSHVADQNYLVRNALDCYCTGKNWCYVAVHSAGNLMIGYALSLYGGTARMKQNATPDASGACSPTDGSTQVGWNIKWVDVSAGAGGGSELANSGDWALDEPLVSDLKTGTARAMYNHNETRGRVFNLYTGASGTLYSFVLPGQDDEVVSYHSSGGVSGNAGAAFCNPSDWFCNDLTLGTKKNEGERAKWSNHSVVFRDDGERYNHYTNQNWGGVTSLVRADMALNAVAAQAIPRPPLGQVQRLEQRPLQAERLARALKVRDAYRAATRYPPTSRPLAEQPDQVDPFLPVVEEMPLRLPGSAAVPGLRLRTSQQRVYSQGNESVLLSVSALDEQGRVLPLRVLQAVAHEGATGPRAARGPRVPVSFTDDGQGGDVVAGDGVLSLRLRPAALGFAAFDGVLRVELSLQSGEQPGFAYFDVIHTARAPAQWLPGGVQEALQDGSLTFTLPLEVQEAGRFVASGRVDHADGKPVALLSFNGELGAGPQALRLQLSGKLVHDLRPRFPLRLRDVEAFLLRPDGFPNRASMPARRGVLHQSLDYPLTAFSNAEWRSEERSRTLAEYGKDAAEARTALEALADPR